MLNVHHLELFYYVARHRGISEAARRIPYGIQQPAISGQIGQLEASLGLSLFQRRPFALTPAGKRLYTFIFPFFSQIHEIAGDLKDADAASLRLGASASALSKHLPEIAKDLRRVFPKLQLTLREIPSGGSIEALVSREIDVALTVKPSTLPSGAEFIELLKLPLVLLVAADSSYKNFGQLLDDAPGKPGFKAGREPLICLPEDEPLAVLFQEALRERNALWETRLEVSSADLGAPYAAAGFGAAVSVLVPGIPAPAGCRAVKLPGFPPLIVGLLCLGPPKPVTLQLAKLCLKKAREVSAAALRQS